MKTREKCICIECRLLLRRPCSDEDEEQMDRCRIYIKCRLLLRRSCTEVLDETRNRWADVLFTLNVVFYSGGRVRRFFMKTRTRWTDVVITLNVVFYLGGRVLRFLMRQGTDGQMS